MSILQVSVAVGISDIYILFRTSHALCVHLRVLFSKCILYLHVHIHEMEIIFNLSDYNESVGV